MAPRGPEGGAPARVARRRRGGGRDLGVARGTPGGGGALRCRRGDQKDGGGADRGGVHHNFRYLSERPADTAPELEGGMGRLDVR